MQNRSLQLLVPPQCYLHRVYPAQEPEQDVPHRYSARMFQAGLTLSTKPNKNILPISTIPLVQAPSSSIIEPALFSGISRSL